MLCDLYDESLQYQENLLAKYFVKHKHQVTIIASTYSSAFDYILNKCNKNTPARIYQDGQVKIIKLPYSLNFLCKLRKFSGVSEILNKEKPDLIFVHDIHLNISDAVNYKTRNSKCKIIMDFHADYSNSAKNWISLNILHKVVRKYVLYKAKDYINKIFYVVPSSAIFLNEVYGISYNEMELLPLGSDTDYANDIRLKGEGLKLRNQFNISSNDIVIFTGGKLTPAKKTEILIEAYQKVLNVNLHLFIIGDASEEEKDYKNYLLNICKGNPRIYFTGWLAGVEVYKYMAASDMAIFPASQSVLWQQAISMGLPLIIGQVGDQDVSYLNKYNNIIFMRENEINSELIAENICKLFNDRQLLSNMRTSALKTAEEYLSYDNLVSKTLTI